MHDQYGSLLCLVSLKFKIEIAERYGGGSKTGGSTGCCGSCFDKSFDEDNFEENLRRDAEKAKSRELHTQPEAAKDMVVNGDTVK